MTLVVAIPAAEGIVLASDSQLTSGAVRAPGEKLFRLNDCCAWAGAGELALIQRVNEAIRGVATSPLASVRDNIATAIKGCVEELLRLDFRTQFFANNPEGLLQLHPGDFIFVECREQNRSILHITSNGTPEWIDRAYAIGNGAPFAYALLRKYHEVTLDIERASLLAFKVIEEAIEVGAYGLGPPLHIWQLTPGGINPLDQDHLAALEDSTRVLREGEIALLTGNVEEAEGATQSGAAASEELTGEAVETVAPASTTRSGRLPAKDGGAEVANPPGTSDR